MNKTRIVIRDGSRGIGANAILWMLSDQASYTTGSFIDVIRRR